MAQGESRVSRAIATACRARGAFTFKIHGGPTMMAGLPDLVMSYRGCFIGLETKMPDGRVSPIQAHRHEEIRKSGGIAAVVRSVDEAMAILDRVDAQHDVRPSASSTTGCTWRCAEQHTYSTADGCTLA
jgi:hypothetical protein